MESVIPLCSICLISLGTEDEPTRLKHCGHTYHLLCVKSWLRKTALCPDCRKPAVDGDLQRDFVLITIIDGMKKLNVCFSDVPSFPSNPPPPSSSSTTTTSTASSFSSSFSSIPSAASSSSYSSAPPVHAHPQDNTRTCLTYHPHPLTIVNEPKTIYPPAGHWFCDICGAASSLDSVMHHCMTCKTFDMCANCLRKGTAAPSLMSPRHNHPVSKVEPVAIYPQYNGKWHCNLCRRNNQSEMYHCYTCKDFDMCGICFH